MRKPTQAARAVFLLAKMSVLKVGYKAFDAPNYNSETCNLPYGRPRHVSSKLCIYPVSSERVNSEMARLKLAFFEGSIY